MQLEPADSPFALRATPGTSEHPKADTGGFVLPTGAPARRAESALDRRNRQLSVACRSTDLQPSRAELRAARCQSVRHSPSGDVQRVPWEHACKAAASEATWSCSRRAALPAAATLQTRPRGDPA